MSVIIIDGNGGNDQVSVHPASKAMRVICFDNYGNVMGPKKTYRAASIVPFVPAVTANRVIAILEGSSEKKITLKRVVISGVTLTAVQYLAFNINKYSTALVGGTRTALVPIPLDSNDGSASVNACAVLTAVGTEGILVGTLASRRTLAQATTPAAAGVTEQLIYEFGTDNDNHGVVLRGIGQGVGVVMPVAPATTPTLSIEFEWTEE